MARYEISVSSGDEPGIARAVMDALHDHGANVDAAVLTVIEGHGSMTALVDVDGSRAEARVKQAIVDRAAEVGVDLTRVEVTPVPARGPIEIDETTPWLQITIWVDVDQPGVLRRLTALLYEQGANIVELFARAYLDGTERRGIIVAEVTTPLPAQLGADGTEVVRAMRAALRRWKRGEDTIARIAVTPVRFRPWSPGL